MSLRRPLAIALTASVALAGLTTVAATAASGATPIAKVQPRAVVDTTVWAAVKTVGLGAQVNFATVGIAVNGQDDTVYIVNSLANLLAVINGRTGLLDDSISVTKPYAVAVDQNDDTIYVVKNEATPNRQVESRLGALPSSIVTTSTNIDSASQLAVDSLDDTVYVARTSGSNLSYFAGSTPSSIVSQNVGGSGVYGIAADQLDDSVWMSFPLLANQYVNVWNGRTGVLGTPTSAVGYQPTPIAVNGPDNRVYVADSDLGAMGRTASRNVYVIDGQTSNVLGSFRLPAQVQAAQGIAVDDSTDRLFVTTGTGQSLGIINEANTDDSVYLSGGFTPTGGGSSRLEVVAVDDSGSNQGLVWAYSPAAGNVVQAFTRVSPSLTAFTGTASARVSFTVTSPEVSLPFVMDDTTVLGVRFNGGAFVVSGLTRENATTWSVALPSGLQTGVPLAVEVRFNGNQVAFAGYYTVQASPTSTPTITSVSPSSGPTSGGTSVTITGTNLTGATSATFAGAAGTITANSATSLTVTTPAGAAGAANVSVTTAGGTATSAGAFTYISPTPPQPDPSRPPGAPGAVLAQAEDERAMVTWSRPSSEGSSPVTSYEAEAFPSGETCTVTAPSTSCTVTGLENGSSYVFRVRARNSVGWSEFSSPSNMVIPKSSASIMITGSRSSSDPQQVRVKGTSTGLGGKDVTPYVRFPGQTSFKAGTGTKKVASDGTFTWQRKTGKRIYVYFQHASIRSNTVNIAPR